MPPATTLLSFAVSWWTSNWMLCSNTRIMAIKLCRRRDSMFRVLERGMEAAFNLLLLSRFSYIWSWQTGTSREISSFLYLIRQLDKQNKVWEWRSVHSFTLIMSFNDCSFWGVCAQRPSDFDCMHGHRNPVSSVMHHAFGSVNAVCVWPWSNFHMNVLMAVSSVHHQASTWWTIIFVRHNCELNSYINSIYAEHDDDDEWLGWLQDTE